VLNIFSFANVNSPVVQWCHQRIIQPIAVVAIFIADWRYQQEWDWQIQRENEFHPIQQARVRSYLSNSLRKCIGAFPRWMVRCY